MKKLLLSLLMTCSFSAAAAPYIGLEYGFGHTEHDVEARFPQDNVVLTPDLEDGIFSGTLGYAFNDAWALELGYSQYELDDGRSTPLGIEETEGDKYFSEMEWDASIKAKQFSIAPVYSYTLNDSWTAKFKAGLTYTQYQHNVSKHKDLELTTNDDVERSESIYTASGKSNKFGAMFSVGAEYEVLPQLTVGANAKYQFDRYANTASLNINTTYYF